MTRPQVERRQRRSLFRRIGTFLPAISILSLAIPVLIYLTVMQVNGWRLPTLWTEGVIAHLAPSSNQTFIYTSPNTKAYFAKIGGNYETLLTPWRDYFVNRKIEFMEIGDADTLSNQKEGVLILPSALSLSDTEREAILAFRARGGAILVTWAAGTRSSSGNWVGWEFLDKLGVKVMGELPPDSEARHLVLTGESPVSTSQTAGTRIWMGKTTESLLRATGEAVAGRFMNWPRILDESRRDEGAIIYSETAANIGRSVFFAFSETTWESRPFVPHQVIDDTLRWLQREPTIVRAAWPNGKLATQIIEMDTEQEFSNALPFAALMKSINYKATFFVLTSVAKQFPEVLRELARDFEISYHADVHVPLKDQSANIQEQRIQNMLIELSSVLPDTKKIRGFRAPAESYDGTTEVLLQKYGIRYHAADPSRLEGRLPSLVKMDGVATEDALIVLARTQRDDINIYWEKLSEEQSSQALINDFDLALDTGSLAFLSIHSQNFGENSTLRKAMPIFLAHIQKRSAPLWLASAGQVELWWRNRERVKLSSTNSGKRLDFNISVVGTQLVEGASFIMMLPQKGVLPIVQASKTGATKPNVTRIDDFRAIIIFDKLAPGNYSYQATFSR